MKLYDLELEGSMQKPHEGYAVFTIDPLRFYALLNFHNILATH